MRVTHLNTREAKAKERDKTHACPSLGQADPSFGPVLGVREPGHSTVRPLEEGRVQERTEGRPDEKGNQFPDCHNLPP